MSGFDNLKDEASGSRRRRPDQVKEGEQFAEEGKDLAGKEVTTR